MRTGVTDDNKTRSDSAFDALITFSCILTAASVIGNSSVWLTGVKTPKHCSGSTTCASTLLHSSAARTTCTPSKTTKSESAQNDWSQQVLQLGLLTVMGKGRLKDFCLQPLARTHNGYLSELTSHQKVADFFGEFSVTKWCRSTHHKGNSSRDELTISKHAAVMNRISRYSEWLVTRHHARFRVHYANTRARFETKLSKDSQRRMIIY